MRVKFTIALCALLVLATGGLPGLCPRAHGVSRSIEFGGSSTEENQLDG